MSDAGTHILDGPTGPLEWSSHGRGEPCTLFVHGLAGSIEETRPFASGVPGRRVFLHVRGHGASPAPPGPWAYDDLAREVRAVADHVRASQVLGVSMGAGAVCALLAASPDRFRRTVLALPAVLDRRSEDDSLERAARLADLIDACDVDAIAEQLVRDQRVAPPQRPAVEQWAARAARRLSGSATSVALRQMPLRAAVDDLGALSAVRSPVLVIAQRDDPLHPVEVAERLVAAFQDGRLEILPPGGVLWAHRATLRRVVGDFLGA